MSSPPDYHTATQGTPEHAPKLIMPHDVQVSSSLSAGPLPLEPPPPYPGGPSSSTGDSPKAPPETSPLAFLDIMPRMRDPGAMGHDIAPKFDSYPTVIATANQWLQANPYYHVWKCESIEKKVDRGPHVKMESMFHHDSTFGFNVYVKGLRLWITPKDPRTPPQQIALLTHVPKKEKIEGVYSMNGYGIGCRALYNPLGIFAVELREALGRQNLKKTLETINEKLKSEPIPGTILNVETSWDKAREGFLLDNYDPDCMCRHEKGGTYRIYLCVFRIFYIVGSPANEEIDVFDAIPECTARPNMNVPPKFQTFSDTVRTAGLWLQQQQGIRVVNILSHECPMRWFNAEVELNNNSMVEQELFTMTNHFVKIVRVIFVRSKETVTSSFGTVCLTSRLFIPVRIGQKTYEPMPTTVWRLAAWLRAAGQPILGVDTQRMLVTNMTRGCGVEPDRMDTRVDGTRAKYWITAIRVYFPTVYQEPPSHLLPPTQEWHSSSSGSNSSSSCVLL